MKTQNKLIEEPSDKQFQDRYEEYEYAILKWRYIVNNNGSEEGLTEAYPDLSNFIASCSYCEEYLNKGCLGCPLNLLGGKCIGTLSACYEKNHPFRTWFFNKNTTNAQAVLNLIIKTKPEI